MNPQEVQQSLNSMSLVTCAPKVQGDKITLRFSQTPPMEPSVYVVYRQERNHAFYGGEAGNLLQRLTKSLVFILVLASASALAQDYVWRTFAGAMPGGADGPGDQAQFYYPYGMTSDANGNLYVADDLNHTVRKVLPNGSVSTLAGKAGYVGAVDGPGALARFNRPSGVAVDSSGNVYVCDRGNHCIRKISPAGEVTTFAGRLGVSGGNDGSASQARFRQPRGIAVDNNDMIYVADTDSHTIRKILTDGTVSTLAGLSQTTGSSDGLGSLARFNLPVSLCASSGGELFVTDTGNHTIRKVAVTGEVTTFTGLAGQAGNINGGPSVAKFNNPSGVCITQAGDFYVSDRSNRSIRKITSSGDVTTVTGGGGWINGSLGAARFSEPTGITMNANGEIYISDCTNFAIRKIGLDNMVTTLAGRPTWGLGNGNLQSAMFNYAGWGAVTVGLSGRLYIADTFNFAIRQIQGLEVATAAGMVGVAGTADGPSASARFGHLTGITSDALGNVYVSQANNH
jgi:streptogramin lyase